MLQSLKLALGDLPSKPFRSVLWVSLALTILMFAALEVIIVKTVHVPWPWVQTAIDLLSGALIIGGSGYVLAPVTALFAGFFLDDIAKVTEQTHYGYEPLGTPISALQAAINALRFTGIVLLANVFMLALLFVPGVNLVIFYLGNGFLLGREYFEVAAGRFLNPGEVARLRERYQGRIFLGGLVIAVFVSIPLLNLLTPLFATAFMVHEYKAISAQRT